jgi:hypothetical protein
MRREFTSAATACAGKEIEPKRSVAENADPVSIPGASTRTTAGSQDNLGPEMAVDAALTSAGVVAALFVDERPGGAYVGPAAGGEG